MNKAVTLVELSPYLSRTAFVHQRAFVRHLSHGSHDGHISKLNGGLGSCKIKDSACLAVINPLYRRELPLSVC
ncbi:uncharacterized protein TrAtP1_002431 [Trichoderma atroviride]|uniref:uncharacterized protein n=1 Tax=Hypocrea atroviridis TaxID=63577 RepID=UPI00331F5CDA|nr:hypothetical protein TrAtP1_002431 [Trichoderma atroviride]